MKAKYSILLANVILGMFGANTIASAQQKWVNCTPTTVGTFAVRIHIRCAQSLSGVVFFAYGTSDAAGAARYVSLATSALIAGRNVRVLYDPADQSGTGIGCDAAGCRLLQGLEIE